ncbi:5666_t:CDS:1, partial [Dentiscutata heterogama]
FIVSSGAPFSIVDNLKSVGFVSPEIELSTSNIIKDQINKTYHNLFFQLKSRAQQEKSTTLSFYEIYLDKFDESYKVITCNWLTKDFELHKILLLVKNYDYFKDIIEPLLKWELTNLKYYDDDFAAAIQNGDGSEWDIPPTSPVDGKDPFASIEWKNISSYELNAFEQRINNSGFKFYDFDDMKTNTDSVTNLDDKINETTYCWPDEMLGPLAPSEVTIYQPTPYQSEDED